MEKISTYQDSKPQTKEYGSHTRLYSKYSGTVTSTGTAERSLKTTTEIRPPQRKILQLTKPPDVINTAVLFILKTKPTATQPN